MLDRIRNMWQFANLFQFIMLFGQALKLDDSLDIEVRYKPCVESRRSLPRQSHARLHVAVSRTSKQNVSSLGPWPCRTLVSVSSSFCLHTAV